MSEIEVAIDECARESEQELGTDREAATTRCAEQDAIFDSCIVGQQQRRSSTVSVAEEQAQVRGTPTGPKRSGKKRSTGKSSSRRSGSDDRTATGGGSTKSTSYVRQEEYDAELDRLQRLSNAALEGDSAALDQLRTALDDVAHVWHRLADLQLHVELALVEKIASADPLRREAFLKRNSEIRSQLRGDDDSLWTSMAGSRMVMCWLFVQFVELYCVKSAPERFAIKQLELAERRYQTSVRTFVMAKRLDLQLQQFSGEN